ncbi:MAG: sulfatase-like hydrolase/transferase [Candidatus Tritonobacter lacicola]|nr:sulfatase-like hydrolase/transferase [Candidatus Tritonobacter lacicola]
MKKVLPLILLAAVVLVLLAAVYLQRRRGEWNNLLLITLDTTRADRLGCYGYSEAKTPALDGLAESGVRFNRSFCNVPLTLPSHATIMTGLYPPEHGCRVNGAHDLGEGLTTLAEIFASRGYKTAAFVAAFVLDSRFGLDRGFRTYDDYEIPAAEDIYDGNVMYRYRRGDKVADAALSWLEENSHKPFFCWVHFFDPHRPYYTDRLSVNTDKLRGYDTEIAFMDSQIERLIEYLKKEDMLEKTLVVVVGDHGESLGEHGEDEHGLLLYSSSMHVPMIFSRPGSLPESTEVESPVSTVDLFTTILDLFGWKPPGRTSGRSFAPALSGVAVPGMPFYSETEFPLTEYGWSPLASVTDRVWKYIKAPRGELYNLRDDPKEMENLATDRPHKVQELKAELAAIEGGMAVRESSDVALDELSQKVLESLGYLGGGGAVETDSSSLRDPKDAVGMRREFIRAVEYSERGEKAKAEGILRKLIKESPESYAFRYKLAKMLYKEGRYQEARKEFEEMAKMAPEEYRTHYNLGKTLAKLGLFDGAIDEFRKAVEFDPEQTAGYNNLGIALLRSGRIREAMDAFHKSISMDYKQVDPHNNLGNALLSLGRTDEAMKEFRRAVEIDPDFFEGRYNLGLALFNRRQYKEAAREFRETIRLRPGFAEARKKLELALALSGRSTGN